MSSGNNAEDNCIEELYSVLKDFCEGRSLNMNNVLNYLIDRKSSKNDKYFLVTEKVRKRILDIGVLNILKSKQHLEEIISESSACPAGLSIVARDIEIDFSSAKQSNVRNGFNYRPNFNIYFEAGVQNRHNILFMAQNSINNVNHDEFRKFIREIIPSECTCNFYWGDDSDETQRDY